MTEYLPFAIFTGFWAVVGIVLPIFIPKGPNKGVIQLMLILTAVTAWMFWLVCYVAQMNPLIGPRMEKFKLLVMAKEWGHELTQG